MRNERIPWLVSVPLMAAGCLAAHAASYAAVADPTAETASHGYLAHVPLALAIALAVGLVAAVRAALAGRAQRPTPSYVFAVLPPLAFSVQEHLERLPSGAAALETALEPTFLVGLGLQVPFALCALVVARGLLRAADVLGAVASRARNPLLRPPRVLRPLLVLQLSKPRALSSPHAGRAPPVFA